MSDESTGYARRCVDTYDYGCEDVAGYTSDKTSVQYLAWHDGYNRNFLRGAFTFQTAGNPLCR